MLKLSKTTGIIEAVLLSTALITPMILFMKYDYFTLFYVYGTYFLLFGIMCQIFQTDVSQMSFIMNTIKSAKEKSNRHIEFYKNKVKK
jgi:hypothetical protein